LALRESFDVGVVGSGAAGAMAALRSADRGLSVLILEKAQKFGGTSATSGGHGASSSIAAAIAEGAGLAPCYRP
jgi:succinate dehydrogenase/fumarate reductase flavoprotein subunit